MAEMVLTFSLEKDMPQRFLVGWEFAERLRQRFFSKNEVNILSSTYPSAIDVLSFSSGMFMSAARVSVLTNELKDPLGAQYMIPSMVRSDSGMKLLMKPSTISNALDVSTDRLNMWQRAVASAILAIAEDELRSGSSTRYYKYLCSSWQLPETHVPLTAEVANYIRETSTKRSILAERANAYSTGHTKNIYNSTRSDSSAAWSSLREVHHMTDVLEVDTHARMCIATTFLDACNIRTPFRHQPRGP